MTHDRLGIGMRVMSVGIPDTALCEITKSALIQPVHYGSGHITSQLIDSDLENEPWRLARSTGHRR
jgi:hypothetical protein